MSKVPSNQQINTLLEYFNKKKYSEAKKIAINLTKEFPQHAFGWKALGSTQELNKKHERLHEFFFDAERKRMTTINNLDGEKWAFTKGALDPIEGIITKIYENDELVNINDSHLEKIREANHSMASGALRVLALTCKRIEDDEDYNDIADVEKDMIFLGLIGIRDPPRSEAYEAIATCHEAGIRVIMITRYTK